MPQLGPHDMEWIHEGVRDYIGLWQVVRVFLILVRLPFVPSLIARPPQSLMCRSAQSAAGREWASLLSGLILNNGLSAATYLVQNDTGGGFPHECPGFIVPVCEP